MPGVSHLERDAAVEAELVEPEPEPELADGELVDGELVDAELVPDLPVIATQGEVAPARWSEHPTVQAAAAAATGFVAGAATLALMQRYSLRRVTRHVPAVRDVLDPAAGRLRSPYPTGSGQTYLVYVRAVTARPPE